ncbi:MAG: SusC/RagA family TonB-linked outer membrane protein [Prevotella sp.]
MTTTILNKKRLAGLLVTCNFVFCCANAQNHPVSGYVKDAATGKPVAGVSIVLGRNSAISDAKGYFRLKEVSPNGVLTLTRDGYSQRYYNLRGDTLVNIGLYSEAFRDRLSSDAFTDKQSAINMEEVLAQRAGDNVRTIGHSAVAGQGSTLFIRGYQSLLRNTQPLIIVDGTIWDENTQSVSLFEGFTQNPLTDIDPTDIEKVEIIKDATSIYGAKGANGAIVITTRRSHSTVTRIAVDMSYGFNWKPKTYDVMNASDFRTYLSEIQKGASANDGLLTDFKGYLGTDPSASDYTTYHNRNNWNDDVYQTGATEHVGLHVDGSDDIAKYVIGIGYTHNKGTVSSLDFSRLTARINADITLHKRLTLGTQVFFTYMNSDVQDDGVNANTSPSFIANIKSPFLVPYAYTDDGLSLTNTLNDVDILGVSNPLSLIQNAKNTNKHYRLGLSANPEWTIDSHFSLNGRFSYMLTSTKEHYFSPMLGVSPIVDGGNIYYNTIKDQSLSQNNIMGNVELHYGNKFGLSSVNCMVGSRILHTSLKSSYAEGHNSGNDKVINLNNSLGYRSVNGINTDWGSAAIYARAGYDYDGRYAAWAILTTEASSRFGSNAGKSFDMMGGRWGLFPSAGVQWNIGRERFMKGLGVVSDANIHMSYGVTGNDDIPGMNAYSYLAGKPLFSNSIALRLLGISNDELKWETTTKYNVGLSLSFLNDRVTLDFDYYHHTTDDLLTMQNAPIETGQEYVLRNGGKLENSGFDAHLGIKAVNIRNFGWQTDIAVGKYKNKITQLPSDGFVTDILGGQVITKQGSPAGLFYGYKTKGIFTTTEEAMTANLKVQNSDASYSTFAAGDVWFEDVEKDGVINEKDRQVIGDPNPDLTGSWSNRFTYKRLSLDVLFTFSLGADIYNYQRQMLESMNGLWNQTTAIVNRWKNNGQQTDIPRATYGDPMGNSRFSDRWIEDGSYLKLKSVSLNYDIPYSNNYIQGISVWVAANNLLTWTKYLGIDPEVSMQNGTLYQGIDNGLLANGRSFYMGIKINL